MCMFRMILCTQSLFSYSGGRGTFGMSTVFVKSIVPCAEARQLREPYCYQSVDGAWYLPVFTLLFFFRCVILTYSSVLYYWHTEGTVRHQTITEKRDCNTSHWCVYYPGVQRVPHVALNYYLSVLKTGSSMLTSLSRGNNFKPESTSSVCFLFCYTVHR